MKQVNIQNSPAYKDSGVECLEVVAKNPVFSKLSLKGKGKIPKYPAYKDSGVEWIGEIPEHWEVQKGKWLFIKEERPIRKEDGIVTCFRDGEVTLRTNRKTDGFTIALREHG